MILEPVREYRATTIEPSQTTTKLLRKAWKIVRPHRIYGDENHKPGTSDITSLCRCREWREARPHNSQQESRSTECLRGDRVSRGCYLHCAGAPAGSPNAVVTAILQPSAVFTNTRSETPLDVVSFPVTV
jgi:hypothetical protein